MALPHRAHGPIVRAVRLALGRPATEIAASVDKHKGYLSLIESGRRRPGIDLTKSLADTLGVPVAVLTGQVPVIGTLRKAQEIGERQFATDIGVTTLRLRRLEQGSELPDPALVAVIAQRLGVDPAVIGPTTVEEEVS